MFDQDFLSYGMMQYTEENGRMQDCIFVDRCLLFDYLFATMEEFIAPRRYDLANFNPQHISELQYNQFEHNLTENLKHGSKYLGNVVLLSGIMFQKEVYSIDAAILYVQYCVPSEPYDICCMQWNDYMRLFQISADGFRGVFNRLHDKHTVRFDPRDTGAFYSTYTTKMMLRRFNDGRRKTQSKLDMAIDIFNDQFRTEIFDAKANHSPTTFIGYTFLSDVFAVEAEGEVYECEDF